MLNEVKTQKTRSKTFKYNCLAALVMTTLVTGCNDNDKPTPEVQQPEVQPKEGKVNFVLASVDGGSCSLLDPHSNMTIIAGPISTSEGVGVFEDIPADTGLTVVECSGGTYVDEATGESMTPGVLRSYVDITSSEFTATVTPLTEMASRLVEYFDLTPEDYVKVSENVAFSFGLKDVDLSSVVPLDLNVDEMDGTEQGNYGLVLAALSQLQTDIEGDDAEYVINELFVGLANNGLFTSDAVRDWYFDSLENMFDNPRIEPYLGTDEALDIFFHDVVLAPVASQVEYVDADHPESHNLEALTVIDALETSTFDIVGTHLSLKMNVTLGGEACSTHDLQNLSDTNTDIRYNLMLADCPAQPTGEANLVVIDNGRLENTTVMTIVEPGTWDYTTGIVNSSEANSKFSISKVVAKGSSYVFGNVSAEAPAIDPSVGSEHDYSSSNVTSFKVIGTTVELVNASKEVIATTTTDGDGYYEFSNAPESTSVSVVVKAEVKNTRASGSTTGPEYSFSVRDNTSTTTPREMYQVSTPFFTTLAEGGSDNTQQDIVATVGFNDNGGVISEEKRQSAPFAILRTMKSGANELVKILPNLSMPALNIYWSGKNIGTDGDKKIGQIGTSHYNGQGLLPGLYILGKADSDTDEFDQGVIGHEFGHFLQDKLSYSDSPGGDHANGEYKDASLSYGEGYGTAIGGLLSGSKYYCDVTGNAQTEGSCEDLSNTSNAGEVNGFYSESSVTTLMYAIGKLPGKSTGDVFTAVTKMRNEMHSATIFSFLHHYLAANPDVTSQVEALMVKHNIKSSDPFGILPSEAAVDQLIAAENNKKDAQTGANDLEKLYIDLVLDAVDAPSGDAAPALLTPNSTTFCVNTNLHGAKSHNGLGMRRRLTFTANFTGDILVRAKNKLDHTISDQNSKFEMRDEDGKKASIYGYYATDFKNYYGIFEVVSGKKYSLKFSMENPEAILDGSQCGFKVELARPAS